MKSHGSPMGLTGLWLMEGSPTSPTTLRVGLVGLTKLTLLWIQSQPVLCGWGYDLHFTINLTTCCDVSNVSEGVA